MFTGIIESRGQIKTIAHRGQDCRMTITAGGLDMSDVKQGDSIAVDGVCLTVVQHDSNSFVMDVSAESLSRTALGDFDVGRAVNLEKALLPTTRLGGHLVSGHVDGVATIESREQVGDSLCFQIRLPDELAKYVAVKGSVCVDGVSLTVNKVEGPLFEMNIIPHTAEMTTIGEYQSGRRVNIEVDLIARYLERLLLGDKAAEVTSQGVTLALLSEHGFLKG
jgi:riboflavin synthase